MLRRIVALMCLVMLTSSLFLGAAQGAPEGLIITATASGKTMSYDDGDCPIPAKPCMEAHEAFSLASFDSGPTSHGLASAFWPGSAGANFGPVYGLPAYPVRAETFYPKGPKKDVNEPGPPGLSMKAESTEEMASAASSTGEEDGSPGASAGRLTSSVTTFLEEEGGVSEATATVKDLNIGDGAITIESVVTTARITSDGKKAKVTGQTTVSGVMVAGQLEATIDEEGLHFNDETIEIPDIFGEPPVEDALDQIGVSVKVARPIQRIKGGSAVTELGGLVVKFEAGALKSLLEPLPDEVEDEIYKAIDMRKEVIYRFGSVSLGVDANDAAFELPKLPPTEPPPPVSDVPFTGDGGGAAPGFGIPDVGGGDFGGSDPPVAAPPEEPEVLAAEPTSIAGKPLPFVILALALATAIASTRVLRHVAYEAVAGSANSCPYQDVG